jgi:hypothetical protein
MHSFYPPPGKWEEQLRKEYPDTGLYRNDATRTRLWTASGRFVSEHTVHLASDGKHCVLYCPQSPNDKDLFFFTDGVRVKSYTGGQLADLSKLGVYSTGGLFEEPGDGGRLRALYFLNTADGNEWVFDADTGEIVSHRYLWQAWVLRGLLVAVVAGAGYGLFRLWRWKRKKALTAQG